MSVASWPPYLTREVMQSQSAECSWGTSRVTSRCTDWGWLVVMVASWYIQVMQVFMVDNKWCVQIGGILLAWWVGVVYAGDEGFYGWHQGVPQGAQIGGIVHCISTLSAPAWVLGVVGGRGIYRRCRFPWWTPRWTSRCTDWRHGISTLSAPAWVLGGGGWAWYIQVMQVFMVDTKVDFMVHRLEASY